MENTNRNYYYEFTFETTFSFGVKKNTGKAHWLESYSIVQCVPKITDNILQLWRGLIESGYLQECGDKPQFETFREAEQALIKWAEKEGLERFCIEGDPRVYYITPEQKASFGYRRYMNPDDPEAKALTTTTAHF